MSIKKNQIIIGLFIALLVGGLFIKIATARQPDSTGHSDTKPSYQGEEKVEEIKEEVKTES